ncbi:uncharacterized protein LAESUDRAFT_751384 [Laetiporus sulphureus 93-53]|uniref:Uncharacterized protein n=1 Tax=Laetiporus sulphureus 93-53 TaxID=1314785 RepID=A0A165D1W8_9APHY|nr:uncharacterized protein LAESUDRAFT_751384 [Laetiporus sulphureus 93-53]KZT03987.1 hypothetical protein LAESUDRAFT_751384 [Laetiporus sulphureus 93-53]
MSTSTKTPRKDVKVGHKIWAKMIIDANALNRPSGKLSTTMKNIFNHKPVLKQAYVLKVESTHLVVAYTTTFGEDTALPENVKDHSAWYPIAPATGAHPPLPELPSRKPAWIYLGPVINVDDEIVEVLTESLSEESIEKVIAALKK